jgi:hypothetical protein
MERWAPQHCLRAPIKSRVGLVRCGNRRTHYGFIRDLGDRVVKSTFVLIHGAWHGGWCWQRVAEILQRAGHSVLAPTLSGVRERSHLAGLEINLTTHVLDVVNEVTRGDVA